ncbi:arylamine N-acetyltransferase [Streptomyces sp. VRA16 Mangrove soil]|uniref:arylamine N-acetyltransferase family protein n=1 Tax=Streptomyces sp. VRA16 Mangrove soil TaxID=2817434 RepID=UPI001A9FCB6D|nr:arylamine N-acetyltransferase [Streptomyces sp. VRA16 Mangrove soil]MBO1335796.1 arylamine N-acetyltransferase [Streptomyces sp. VRA16 Mangrove soil]
MAWNGEDVDIEAYVARIGFEGELKPDGETLRALHRAHVAAIPFENLEMMLGRPVPLELSALEDKLVRRRRGGYCYEHNLLFASVLEFVGFSVTGLGARVRVGASSMRPVTHMLTRVVASDGGAWVCDVGFGAYGLRAPMPLRDGEQARHADWQFALSKESEAEWVLRGLHTDGWRDLYAFTLEGRHPVDYMVMNHYTTTHPRSSFIRRPVVQYATAAERRLLTGRDLVIERPDGSRSERTVRTGELRDLLAHEFEIELSDDDHAELVRRHYAGE